MWELHTPRFISSAKQRFLLLVLFFQLLVQSVARHTDAYLLLKVAYTVRLAGTVLSPSGATAQRGPGPPYSSSFCITHSDTPQSVGLLWTSYRPVAETFKHTTLTEDRHSLFPAGLWPATPASDRPQTLALDRSVTGTDRRTYAFFFLIADQLVCTVFTRRDYPFLNTSDVTLSFDHIYAMKNISFISRRCGHSKFPHTRAHFKICPILHYLSTSNGESWISLSAILFTLFCAKKEFADNAKYLSRPCVKECRVHLRACSGHRARFYRREDGTAFSVMTCLPSLMKIRRFGNDKLICLSSSGMDPIRTDVATEGNEGNFCFGIRIHKN